MDTTCLRPRAPGRAIVARWLMLPLLALGLSGCGIVGGGKDRPGTPTLGNRQPILSRISAEIKPL